MSSDSCIRTIVILRGGKGKREKLLLRRLLARRSKKIKVLIHQPRDIETTVVPKPIEGSYCASEPRRPAPVEARAKPPEEPKSKKSTEQTKALSPLQRMELPKVSKIPATTSKRRRMASILDAVMESAKALTPASTEAPSTEGEIVKRSTEAGTTQTEVEAGPSAPAKARPSEAVEEGAEARPSEATEGPLMLGKEGATEEYEFSAPRAPAEELEFIMCHALGKIIK
jgi:hypothetical protein